MRERFLEYAIVAAAFVCVSVYTASVQRFTVPRYWDADEYYAMTEELAAGRQAHAAAPYVYRLGLPMLVASTFTDITRGFRLFNIVAAAISAALLLVWLARFGIPWPIRTLLAVLYLAAWHGPARFVYYYPLYVDPPFFVFVLLALLLIESAARRSTPRLVALLTLVCFAGAWFRETMAVLAFSFLFVSNPLPIGGRRPPSNPIPAWMLMMPLAACAAALLGARLITAPRDPFSFVDAAVHVIAHKRLFSLPLAWFITFGPILAVLAYDARAAIDFLAGHQYLAVCLAACVVLSYVGGSDTERLLFWCMPIVYLLIARAIVRHRAALSTTALVATLACAQAISARVFWPVPDPGSAVPTIAEMPTTAAKVYTILNRLFVVDDFHWNLWSNFGSVPFHALLLGIYIVFSAFIVWRLHAREHLAASRQCR